MTKTFDKKDVYSWANCEEAKQYLNQKGYFSDSYSDDTNHWQYGKLNAVDPNNTMNGVFVCDDNFSYGLFIPKDKVKEVKEEKKYRPFTLEEFNKVIPMGAVFKCRYKSNDAKDVYSIYYHANLDCENGFQAIFFEDSYHHFDYCFYEMELFLNGRWQPFGVEVEE